jgi:riboflavin kinase/FMN adenylyltransferase
LSEPSDVSQPAAAAQKVRVLRDPAMPAPGLERPVVVIGNFDGVHTGHRAVIAHGQAMAARLGRPCAILTFEPHPADFFAGRPTVFRLTPEAAKIAALARLAPDAIIVLTFDDAVAHRSPLAFVEDILVRRLGVAGVVVGFDFQFGHQRAGTPAFLAEQGRLHGFDVEIVDKVTAGGEEAVHSTAARDALEVGDVAKARAILGHDWFVVGEIVHGQKLGRTLGFPTANMVLDPSCRLRHGIYAVRFTVDGVTHPAVASYGRRPTFDNGAALLETFVFDFKGDLYGKPVEVAFVAWLRGEEKFDGVDALIVQMNRDAARAREILKLT